MASRKSRLFTRCAHGLTGLLAICCLFIACFDVATNPGPGPTSVGPSRVQLVKADGLYADSLFPTIAFSADTSSDTVYNGDSSALLLDSQLTKLTFTILSRNDNQSYMWFKLTRVRLLRDGDTVLIIGDYTHEISDAITVLPATRKYSLDATMHFNSPLGIGSYKFVANVFVSCFCFGVPTYNYSGSFDVRAK